MSEMTLDIILQAIFGKDLARLAGDGGENPFAVVSREPARDLRFAFKFRSLAKLVAELVRRAAPNPPRTFRFSRHVDGGARQGKRRRDERARTHR